MINDNFGILFLIAALFWLGLFLKLIFGAIKEAHYYYEEVPHWTWDEAKEEIHIYFPQEKHEVISKVFNLQRVKEMMKDTGFRYVGNNEYLIKG